MHKGTTYFKCFILLYYENGTEEKESYNHLWEQRPEDKGQWLSMSPIS